MTEHVQKFWQAYFQDNSCTQPSNCQRFCGERESFLFFIIHLRVFFFIIWSVILASPPSLISALGSGYPAAFHLQSHSDFFSFLIRVKNISVSSSIHMCRTTSCDLRMRKKSVSVAVLRNSPPKKLFTIHGSFFFSKSTNYNWAYRQFAVLISAISRLREANLLMSCFLIAGNT